MEKEVTIFGAGGHTRSLISLLKNNSFTISGIYDDSFNEEKKEIINSISVVGNLSNYKNDGAIVLSYGDNYKRKTLFNSYSSQVLKINVSHESSYIDETVFLGQSNFIFTKAILNTNVIIGDNNIINTAAIIEHEVKIGSHNHISVGSIICGRSIIGNKCFLGAGSVIVDKIKICDDVTIGSNSVVIKSILEPGVYVGNPAKKIA